METVRFLSGRIPDVQCENRAGAWREYGEKGVTMPQTLVWVTQGVL